MTEYTDLKAIAEVCQQHQPLRFMRSHGALYIRNDNGIVFDVHQNRSFPEFMAQNKDYADLVLAANPATILALIAENERLERLALDSVNAEYAGSMDIESICAERDQLRAEIAGLRTGYEAYEQVNGELKAENERLRSGMKGDYDLDAWLDWTQEAEELRKDAERFSYIERDADSGMSKIYGDDWVAVIDAALGQGEQS